MMETTRPAIGLGSLGVVIRVLLGFCVIAPVSLVYIMIALLLLPSRNLRIRTGNVYGKLIGRYVVWLAGIRPVISNGERIGANAPALYVCNHTAMLDIWVGMWLCPFGGCGVAKKEIARTPFFGQAYLLSGHLLLDRSNRARAVASLKRIGDTVRRHRLSVWMYPEGTRSRDGRLQPLKKGFVHLAIATGLPVVPVVLRNAHLLWSDRGFRTTAGDFHIEVLDAIDTSAWCSDQADQHAKEVWSRFQRALDAGQQGPAPAGSAVKTRGPDTK